MADTLSLSVDELREMARTIRKDVILMTNTAKSGHPGGPLSAADYLAALVMNYLRVRPAEPYWEQRDRFIISNGHCSALNFSLLSRRGFFNPGYLLTFRTTPSRLQGHPNHVKLPGVEIGTGSLGQGLSVAHGMALGAKLASLDSARVVCNVGDGEMQEGNIWEAIMHAGHRQTDNLVMSIDWNDAQIDGRVREVKRLDPIDKKLDDFHWAYHWADGHDMEDIVAAWDWAFSETGKGKPVAVIFKTVMMKGVGEKYEDIPGWHGRPPKDDEALEMLKTLGYDYADLEMARAEYGEPVYDGVKPPVMAAPFSRVIHAETNSITQWEHEGG